MKSIFVFAVLATVAAGCAAPAEEDASTADQSVTTENTTAEEQLVVSCRQPVDHGAVVSFYAEGPNRKIARAEYTETTIVDTRIVSNMNVCTAVPSTVTGPDVLQKTYGCNDVSWVNGYSVELYEGGFMGQPSIKLYRSGPNRFELVHSLLCEYVDS